MIHKIKKYTEGFTTISNSTVDNNELSNAAFGLLVRLLRNKSDWVIYLSHLFNTYPDGRRRIESQMNELIEKGYVIKTQGQNKFKDTQYDAYEIPKKSYDILEKSMYETDKRNCKTYKRKLQNVHDTCTKCTPNNTIILSL